jgi:type IV pilus assembly protein PilY1
MTPHKAAKHKRTALCVAIALLFSQSLTSVHAASTDIANIPMAVTNMVTPNVLVIYDNSQSMDAYMNGTLVSGNDPNTRGNIGRQVMRNAIGTYRNAFNWGLMSYGMSGTPSLYNTYAYYLGSNTGMVFTNDCVGYIAGNPPTVGTSATNGGNRCIANPQPFTGGNFVTYDKTGDDSDIQDVLYTNGGPYTGLWGLTAGAGTSYNVYTQHNASSGNSWAASAFTGSQGTWNFTPTDAGYLSNNPPMTRQIYTPRGWGFNQNITGSGNLDEQVAVDSTTHYNTLISKLGSETNGSTGELKNGAVFTPLRGTLQSAKTYFSSSLAGKNTPVGYTCQQNFVMLVTDGLPTGDTSGNLYSATDRTNSCNWSTASNTCTSGALGTAANDAIVAAKNLRTTSVTGYTSTNKDGTGVVTGKYDVQTYVVALGDTVANANALSVMNAMAYNGGTVQAIPANNATAFQNAIQSISDDITAKVGSSAAVAVANAHVSSSDNDSFASSYNSGTWTGDLDSNALNPATGVPSNTSSWTAGSAGTQLDARTPASRFIVTSIDTSGAIGGIQFQPATATATTKLSAAQQALLNTPSSTDGVAVLAYLRGDRTAESITYRARAHLLGDMVNGEPVVVTAPNAAYTDTGYSAFTSSNSSRTRMVFQGANDGMLHAFVASSGAEAWAYIPNMVMANLNNLSLKTGFTHKYYVDGTPTYGDVDFNNIAGISTGGDWRTVLVGGLGKGGRGYFALDISSATAASELDVNNKVLWEFPNSISNSVARTTTTLNMGYSFGKPIIVKTAAKGWVALVTSGYNNGTNAGDSGGDGVGHLYVINPKTGDLISDIPTTGCTTSPANNPCGLAQISASIASNNTVDYVYGGDLKGNLWRFDLTSATSTGWSVAKLTTLVDSSSVAQPITTAPALSVVETRRMIQVGTGQYLGDSDVTGTSGANSTASQTQTIYGLWDGLVAMSTPLRSNLQQQTYTTSAGKRTLSNNTVNYPTQKGWYIDLGVGERVNTQCSIAIDNLVCTSNTPSPTKCAPGGESWEYVVSSKTGSKANRDTNSWSGTYLGTVLASRPVIITNANGQQFSLVRLSNATTHTTTLPPPPATSSLVFKRTSWRQIYQ